MTCLPLLTCYRLVQMVFKRRRLFGWFAAVGRLYTNMNIKNNPQIDGTKKHFLGRKGKELAKPR